jgi:uncharacterized protein YecE (DUF72 family)
MEYNARVARAFFAGLRKRFDRGVAVEPRHPSWFDTRADQLLNDFEIARVAADPPRAGTDAKPGGWRGLAYFRLHGSPRIYYSSYEDDYLTALADELRGLRRRRIAAWCIFDNTTLGAGTSNALSLMQRLEPVSEPRVDPRGEPRRAAPPRRRRWRRAARGPMRRT